MANSAVSQPLASFDCELPLSMQFASNGIHLAVATKSRTVSIGDVRGNFGGTNSRLGLSLAGNDKVHPGGKPVKLCWMDGCFGPSYELCTTGTSASADRQLRLWDLRKPEKHVKSVDVDRGMGVMFPFYDADTRLLFLAAKGDSSVKYFEHEAVGQRGGQVGGCSRTVGGCSLVCASSCTRTTFF